MSKLLLNIECYGQCENVDQLLVEAIKDGKYIRFIGGSLNFAVDVHKERLGNHNVRLCSSQHGEVV